jgi:hypothetical protein
MQGRSPGIMALLLTVLVLAARSISGAETLSRINLSGASAEKTDIGFFPAGTTLSISITGTTVLAWEYMSQPDGSLAGPMSPLDTARAHANPGSRSYPTDFGGDGVNHFRGGGMNYVPGHGDAGWPKVGKRTTDTSDPAAIRFGVVVGTFHDSPEPADWFCVGSGTNLVVPQGGRHLYLLVNDSVYTDNSGGYWVAITSTPQSFPSRLIWIVGAPIAIGAIGLWLLVRSSKPTAPPR